MLVRSLFTIAVLGTVLMFPAIADASLQVTLTAGSSSTTITDGGAGDDDLLVNGQIGIVSELVGGYDFFFTLVTNNSPGTPLLAFLTNSTGMIADVGGGATTVSIYANSTGFTAPTGSVTATSGFTGLFLPQSPNGNTATVSYSALVDPANGASTTPTGTVVGTGSAPISQPGSPAASLSNSSVLGSLSPTYALNLFLSATLGQAGSAIDLDGQVSLSAVPEPATVVVWSLLGILGAVVGRKIVRQRS